MELLADAVEAGKVKAVGVSNYSAEQMRIAHAALARRGIPLASNQVEYSLLHRQPEVDGVLDACRELAVTLIAYTPLAGGLLTGKYSAQNRPGGFFRRILPQYNRKALDAIQPVIKLLREIGERYSKIPSQVALRWLIENPIVLPIPGAKSGKQAMDNAEALSFSLTSEEVDALNQATLAWRVSMATQNTTLGRYFVACGCVPFSRHCRPTNRSRRLPFAAVFEGSLASQIAV